MTSFHHSRKNPRPRQRPPDISVIASFAGQVIVAGAAIDDVIPRYRRECVVAHDSR